MWVNLNLTKKYAPSFNEHQNWPVAREVISNAIDADPTGYTVQQDPNRLVVRTKTEPTVEQVLVIGEGSKDPGGGTIGQFGEGLKVAANATIRGGGKMTVELPGSTITYAYRLPNGFTVPTLHANVKRAENGPGATVIVELDNVGLHADKILDFREQRHMLRGADDELMKVYVKGIWAQDVEVPSMHHYNLVNSSINRDRGVVNYNALRSEIFSIVLNKLDKEMAKKSLDMTNKALIETDLLALAGEWWVDNETAKKFEEAFREEHGPMAVLSSAHMDPRHDAAAEYIGYKVVRIPLGMEKWFKDTSVKRAIDVIPDAKHLKFVENMDPAWAGRIANLNKLVSLLDVPGFELKVFEDVPHLSAMYQRQGEKVIVAISRSRMEHPETTLLYSAFLHELAHVVTLGADDQTLPFEEALSMLLGMLGKIIVEPDKEVTSV